MNINEAQAVIQAEAESLTTAIRAKGYDGYAEIWIGRHGIDHSTIYTPSQGKSAVPLPYLGSATSETLTDLLAEARRQIAAMPHRDAEALAYADELAMPLYLLSEQHARAAE